MIKTIHQKPTGIDSLILFFLVILITLQPYFLHGGINIFEVGLYVPGIQAIFNGEIPYRDFFHLRGPMDLYMPAFLMQLFGIHIGVLYSYFYLGNVLCLVLCVLIARELYKTRLILYLMVPVLVGRTFPRVVYMFWGGMRYAFGLLAVLLIIKFVKREKLNWIFWAGISTALGMFTSIEIGIYTIMGVLVLFVSAFAFKLMDWRFLMKSAVFYILGFFMIAFPLCGYLAVHQALLPYWDITVNIVTRMQEVIDPHSVSVYPRNFFEALTAMTNPNSINFKHMTPTYLYIFLLGYLICRIKNKKIMKTDLILMGMGVYGFVM